MSNSKLANFVSIQVLMVLIILIGAISTEAYTLYVQAFLLGAQICCFVHLMFSED